MENQDSKEVSARIRASVEGEVSVSELHKAIAALSSIATNQLVVKIEVCSLSDTREETEQSILPHTVSLEDFKENWGLGASWCWGYLSRLAINNNDFPLQRSENVRSLEGDVSKAIDWMNQHGRGDTSTAAVLVRIRDSRIEPTDK